eukprot:scaffold13717_cov132-Isochrysis_galbana.AAC.4
MCCRRPCHQLTLSLTSGRRPTHELTRRVHHRRPLLMLARKSVGLGRLRLGAERPRAEDPGSPIRLARRALASLRDLRTESVPRYSALASHQAFGVCIGLKQESPQPTQPPLGRRLPPPCHAAPHRPPSAPKPPSRLVAPGVESRKTPWRRCFPPVHPAAPTTGWLGPCRCRQRERWLSSHREQRRRRWSGEWHECPEAPPVAQPRRSTCRQL